jgi:hypothetical protein
MIFTDLFADIEIVTFNPALLRRGVIFNIIKYILQFVLTMTTMYTLKYIGGDV